MDTRYTSALELFRKSAEIDPTFAPAWAGAGYAHLMHALFGAPVDEAMHQARDSAQRAIALEEALAEAHVVMGVVHLADRDWPAAGRKLERALELNPNDAAAHHAYADFLTVTGRPEEGLAHIEQGLRCDPLSPLAHIPLIGHLQFLGRYDASTAAARRALELFPELKSARRMLGWALGDSGQREEGLAQLGQSWKATPGVSEALEHGFAEAGARGAMAALADQLATRWAPGRDPLVIAKCYARAGKIGPAIEWLERAYDQRHMLLIFLEVDPTYDPLRGDPSFEGLVSRIGIRR